ncbi:hypothetical protein ACGF0J_18830, partial [Nonomuraea sp. NPDC047897]
AGKTGTNNNNKEAWFVGFTPQLSTAVGMFRQECKTKSGKVVPPKNDICPVTKGKSTRYDAANPYSTPVEVPLGAAFEGATYPAATWRTFMTEAMKNMPVQQFPPRADIGMTESLVPEPAPPGTPRPTPSTSPTTAPDDPWGDDDAACCQDDANTDPQRDDPQTPQRDGARPDDPQRDDMGPDDMGPDDMGPDAHGVPVGDGTRTRG